MNTLKGKRVLVTGGAGFVGSHICDELFKENVGKIIVVDDLTRGRPENLDKAFESSSMKFVEGDFCDKQLLEPLLKSSDIVFHQAALRITQCAAEPKRAMDVMVNGTFQLLELCVKHGIQKVIAASSASVYGSADSYPTPESHHGYSNRTLYGAAKAFNEGLLRSFNEMYGLQYVALRYFNVIGPRMDVHGKYTEVLIRWIEKIQRNEPLVIFGDGTQSMDFIDVRDVAIANVMAAKSDRTDRVYNIGSSKETSLRELAFLLLRLTERTDLRIIFESERAVNPVRRRLSDTSLAEAEIGFSASVSLEQSLHDILDWMGTKKLDEGGQKYGFG